MMLLISGSKVRALVRPPVTKINQTLNLWVVPGTAGSV
jgi:hypothetical protein